MGGQLKPGRPGKPQGRKLINRKRSDTYVFDLIREMEILGMLTSALELGIFEMIGRGGVDLMAEARKMGYDPDAFEALLNALRVTKFIRKNGSIYELCEITGQIMENPFLVDNLRLAKVYTAVFKYHARVKGKYLHILDSDDLQAITALGKHSAQPLVECLYEWIPGLKTKPLSVLDIGCGQGYLLTALSMQNPKLKCTGVDINEEALFQATENLKQAGLKNVKLKKTDMHTPEFGNAIDVVTFFTSTRGKGKCELREMAHNVCQSLKTGGYFIIQDFFLENHRRAPLENVFFDLRLALSTRGGKVFSLSEFEGLKNVGFKEFQMRPITSENVPVTGSAFFIYRK